MEGIISIKELQILYPDEWILLGNPVHDDNKNDIVSGVPVFHSKDKKEVCYIGRDKTKLFDKVTLIYTGTSKPMRKITGIFNRVL